MAESKSGGKTAVLVPPPPPSLPPAREKTTPQFVIDALGGGVAEDVEENGKTIQRDIWADDGEAMRLDGWLAEVQPTTYFRAAFRGFCREGRLLDAKFTAKQWSRIYNLFLKRPTR